MIIFVLAVVEVVGVVVFALDKLPYYNFITRACIDSIFCSPAAYNIFDDLARILYFRPYITGQFNFEIKVSKGSYSVWGQAFPVKYDCI